MEFFEEIVEHKRELQRCTKFSTMCATMACRSAVKVGEALSKEQMRREVNNLATLASPWNCPHGRPTLIELGGISVFTSGIRTNKEYAL
jgi:DNA mismatch repair ATPase MutL